MRKTDRCNNSVPTAVLLIFFVLGAAVSSSNAQLALTPPRGWNSYDSFSWVITEEEFLQNAEYVAANLLQYGYEYVVVDFLWYRKHEDGAYPGAAGFENIDEWGRLVPDPVRWPSTKDGKGFKPIADKVHAMGLKFGIHVMRGISTAAVDKDTPVLGAEGSPEGPGGRPWTAKDIAIPGGECSWMKACFIRVNTTTEGGRAFIDALYQQYAEWGVDFIKHDCVFGVVDLDVAEITAVGEAMKKHGRPMVYSLSPGVFATPEIGFKVAHLSNMYRITMDDWDRWSDILAHFAVARDFAAAGLIGAPGLGGGKSWPDMDMLPIGWLTDPDANYGPYRKTSLSEEEQMTQITLWAMAKSPLMFGGDLRNIDQWTHDLITQPTILELNVNSTNNRELSSSEPSNRPTITLEDCASPRTSRWTLQSSENGSEVCWSPFIRPTFPNGSCINWKDSPFLPGMDSDVEFQNDTSKRGHLWRSIAGMDCLQSNRSADNGTVEDLAFRPCNGLASQAWHLTGDGQLLSEKTRRCAAVKESNNDWRIWVARGVKGQSYVAFFNLGTSTIPISVALDEVYDYENSEELRMRYQWTCTGLDVWRNKTFTANMTRLEVMVKSHGTALFDLRCTVTEETDTGSMLWYFAVSSLLLLILVSIYFFADFRAWFLYRRRLLASKEPSTVEEIIPLRKEKNQRAYAFS